MSTGVFGSIRPANINPDIDVAICYQYKPSRGETDENFYGYKDLDPSECLSSCVRDDDESPIVGLYNLKLPLKYFNKKGIYDVYIKPKECSATIVDVSVLAAYPSVKGVIFNLNSGELNGLTDLTGYRIDYGNGVSRLIKSCNRCEPVIVNTGDGYPKTTRYNLTDSSSNLVFCTVSPSSAPTFKTNASPYIGEPGLVVNVVNTKFSPKLIEVEMVDHDMDTISYMLEGDQINDRDNGLITTYNESHEIYHQSEYYVLKDRLGNPLYNVKKKKDNIDHSQDYENII
jgi:hypothetical protein